MSVRAARRLTTVLVLTAVLLCCGFGSGSALAGGTVTPIRSHFNPEDHQIAGPAFAGDAVAYAVPIGRPGYNVRIQQPDGTTSSQLVRAKGGGRVGVGEAVLDNLAASPQVVAFAHNYFTCGGCAYLFFDAIESTVFAGPLGGPLDFRGCSNYPYATGVDASGGAVAYLDSCADAARVADPTRPESESRAFPADLFNGYIRLAGRYLAVMVRPHDPAGPEIKITVYDWQTGDVVYEIAGDYNFAGFDIQDDGTMALDLPDEFADQDSAKVYWASPQDPSLHLVTRELGSVLIADGKIAVSTRDSFAVFARDGTRLAATSNSASIGGFDFDGKRIAYIEKPCAVNAIVTWDLSGQAPTLPAGRCPAARAAGKGVVELNRRRVALPLRCPSRPALGCEGTWYAEFNKVFVETSPSYVTLLPGEKRTVRLPLSRKNTCRLARHPATRATIELTNYRGQRLAEEGTGRFKLRYSGRARGCK